MLSYDEYIRDYQSRTPAARLSTTSWGRVYQGLSESNPSILGPAVSCCSSISGIIRVEPQHDSMLAHASGEYIRDYQSRTPAHHRAAQLAARVYQGLSESNPSHIGGMHGQSTSISGIIRVEPQQRLQLNKLFLEYIRDYQSRTPAIASVTTVDARVYQGLSESNPSNFADYRNEHSSISGIIRVELQPCYRGYHIQTEYIRDYQSRTPAGADYRADSCRVYQGLSESNPSIHGKDCLVEPSISGIIRVEPQLVGGGHPGGVEYIRDYQSRTPAC